MDAKITFYSIFPYGGSKLTPCFDPGQTRLHGRYLHHKKGVGSGNPKDMHV